MHAKELLKTGANLRYVGLDRRPNPARLADSTAPMPRRYRFEVRVSGIDVRTGAPCQEYITLRGNGALTRREIEEHARICYAQSRAQDDFRYGIRDVSFQLESGAFNPDIKAEV